MQAGNHTGVTVDPMNRLSVQDKVENEMYYVMFNY
jgi:hypothetical protein